MKARSFFIIVLYMLTVLLGAAESLGQAKWVSLGGDFQRSGLSEDLGPAPDGVAWTFDTGGALVGSVTVGAERQIHVACEDGKLYTLALDGALLWTLDVNTPLLSAPSIAPEGGLYVGSRDVRHRRRRLFVSSRLAER